MHDQDFDFNLSKTPAWSVTTDALYADPWSYVFGIGDRRQIMESPHLPLSPPVLVSRFAPFGAVASLVPMTFSIRHVTPSTFQIVYHMAGNSFRVEEDSVESGISPHLREAKLALDFRALSVVTERLKSEGLTRVGPKYRAVS